MPHSSPYCVITFMAMSQYAQPCSITGVFVVAFDGKTLTLETDFFFSLKDTDFLGDSKQVLNT